MLTVAPAEGFDSLVSLVDANAYHDAMGNAWTGSDDEKEKALRRATQYLLARYRIWSAYFDPVHKNVAAACCELALRAMAGDLYVDVDPSGVISETVGPIRTTYALRNGGQTRFTIVDDLLAGMTEGGRSMIRLVRG